MTGELLHAPRKIHIKRYTSLFMAQPIAHPDAERHFEVKWPWVPHCEIIAILGTDYRNFTPQTRKIVTARFLCILRVFVLINGQASQTI